VTKRGSRRSRCCIQIVVFCIITACCLPGEYQSFGGECCFYLQSLHTLNLKTGVSCSSETLVSFTYKTARRHNPEDYSSSLSTSFDVEASLEKHCPMTVILTEHISRTFRVHECQYISGFSTTTIPQASPSTFIAL
jgi:hypothetical protein